MHSGTSLAAQWLRLHLPVQGMQVWFLVRKLRSHMQKNQDIKQKQYCTNSLKYFFLKRKPNALNSYLECEYLICGINGQGDRRGGQDTKIRMVWNRHQLHGAFLRLRKSAPPPASITAPPSDRLPGTPWTGNDQESNNSEDMILTDTSQRTNSKSLLNREEDIVKLKSALPFDWKSKLTQPASYQETNTRKTFH